MPVNAVPQDEALFDGVLTYMAPDVRLETFAHVTVLPRKYVLKSARLFWEAFDPLTAQRTESVWRVGRRYCEAYYSLILNSISGELKRVPGPACWITDRWSVNYFHWLCDAIPRLYAIWKRQDDLDLLLPADCERLAFVLESLAPFRLRNVIFAPSKGILRCGELTMPTKTSVSGNHNHDLIREVRKLYSDHFRLGDVQPGRRRIYISRKLANKRRVLNEEELLPVLKKYEFEVLYTETMSFREQMAAFAETELLLSLHGAGLTNMLFMREGSAVVELHNAQRNHCYFALANACGHDYAHLTGETVRQGGPLSEADIICRPQAIEALLGQVLKNKSRVA